ncbi:MAG: GtrA family protein [Candidatus Thermoplasmatota archaeon]|nr:GtrA family protein [Candidatus Thermoplasmatota archaeon]
MKIKDFYRLNRNRAIKFVVTGGGGFLVSEAIITFGLILLGIGFFLAIEITANFLSVTFGFFVNDRWSTRNQGMHASKPLSVLINLMKFQLVYILGAAVSISVQYVLLHFDGISPILGNFAGSAIALVPNYFISMKLVWKIYVTRE